MENKLNLFQRLNLFRQKVGAVKKDGTNPHFKSKYATIESVLETIEKPLNDCGLGYYQIVIDEHLKTIIFNIDNSAETIESSIKLLLPSQDMQKLGSAITYARRYGLVSMFGLEQEDDDGNATTKTPIKTNATDTTQIKYIKKAPSKEKLYIGDPCPDCDEPVVFFKFTDKQTGELKPYWKCKNCGLAGFEVKVQDKLDEEIPF